MPRFTLFFMVGNLELANYTGMVVAGKHVVGAGRGFDSEFAALLRQELEHGFEERWAEHGFPVITIGEIEAPNEYVATEREPIQMQSALWTLWHFLAKRDEEALSAIREMATRQASAVTALMVTLEATYKRLLGEQEQETGTKV